MKEISVGKVGIECGEQEKDNGGKVLRSQIVKILNYFLGNLVFNLHAINGKVLNSFKQINQGREGREGKGK